MSNQNKASSDEAGRAAEDGECRDQPRDEDAAAAAGDSNPNDRQDADDDLESLRAELAEAKDRTLRLQAELENYRRRVQREMEEERRYAMMPLMRDLLPVRDNIERAIAAAEQARDASSLLEGFRMVSEQFHTVLAKHHCVEIAAMYEPFDPNRHEAIQQLPSDEHAPGTVVDVAQIGFQLHERVVRPSQVIVSKADTSES